MHFHKTAIVGNLRDGTLILDHNLVKQQTMQRVQCTRSSAGYYVDMNEIIGKRPVYTSYANECHVPSKPVALASVNAKHRDVSCKTPIWSTSCI